MSGATQARRIDTLEQQVGAFESRFDSLDRQISDFRLDVAAEFVAMRQEVGVQISQLRNEMHVADSAIRDGLRAEIRVEGASVRDELRAEIRVEGASVRDELRAEIRAEGAAVRDELRKEIRDGDEETRRYMRVLHEEVIERIARLGEAAS